MIYTALFRGLGHIVGTATVAAEGRLVLFVGYEKWYNLISFKKKYLNLTERG